jgi:hypothetical protein
MSSFTSSAGALLGVLLLASHVAAQDAASLRTAPERTNYRETTRYADVVTFMERAAAASPVIELDTMGYTFEGRALPMAIVSRGLRDKSAASIRASGKTVIYLQGNIHAGEVEGKESLLILLREFAQGRHQQLLDSLVLLVVPIYNADGNERISITNRGVQHGPIGGMGTRPNAQGLNINRDYAKLDTPEARSMALMFTTYDPHVGVDLHTTNGTRHAYYVTYSPPLHPNTHSGIIALLRQDWLPAMTRTLKQKHDWDYYYYGNLQGQGEARGWYTFEHTARFNNNYVGLRNRFAILSEAYSYATFSDRILATSRFVEEILAYAHRNAARIRQAVAAADRAPIIGQQLALRATYDRSPEQVEILMGDVIEERNPYSGATILKRANVRRPERMFEYGTFRATESEVAPSAYIVTERIPAVLSNLDGHGVRYEVISAATTMQAEAFRVDSTRIAANESEGHRMRTVFGSWQPPSTVNVAAGAVRIPMNQPLARLVFTLLEPRSDDSLTTWNYFDRWIEGNRPVPVVRVR